MTEPRVIEVTGRWEPTDMSGACASCGHRHTYRILTIKGGVATPSWKWCDDADCPCGGFVSREHAAKYGLPDAWAGADHDR